MSSGFRGLVFLQGNVEHVHTEAASYIKAHAELSIIIVGDHDFGTCIETINRPDSVLGREFSIVIFDAFHGLDPNLLGAVAGCIASGGLLLFCCPHFEQWHHYADPYLQRIAMHPETTKGCRSRFIHRFVKIVMETQQLYITASNGCAENIPSPICQPKQVVVNTAQNQVIDKIIRVVDGQRKKPLVIVADRGRGKTTALGYCGRQPLENP